MGSTNERRTLVRTGSRSQSPACGSGADEVAGHAVRVTPARASSCFTGTSCQAPTGPSRSRGLCGSFANHLLMLASRMVPHGLNARLSSPRFSTVTIWDGSVEGWEFSRMSGMRVLIFTRGGSSMARHGWCIRCYST
ncbi:hypothetical protein BCL80_12110 [Streptomyces avidinii]|nr:hypothetical protein BCL80_12110 [Streptomyces avidinii]SNX79224.1 hypothetical protein SAMN05421860_107515 [Streptomyces microflavus]